MNVNNLYFFYFYYYTMNIISYVSGIPEEYNPLEIDETKINQLISEYNSYIIDYNSYLKTLKDHFSSYINDFINVLFS